MLSWRKLRFFGWATIAAPGAAVLFVAGCGGSTTPAPAAAECKVSVSVSQLDFGNVGVGECRDLFVRITNSGTVGCDCVASLSLGPPHYSIFSGDGSFTLKPNQQHTVAVRFCPGEKSTLLGSLRFACDGKSIDVPLSGTGGDGSSGIRVTPDPLDFGSVRVGFPPVQKDFTIENAGTAANTLTGSVPVSTDANFTVTAGQGAFSLAAGETKTVTVEFEPKSVGTITYILPITHDSDNAEQPYLQTLKGIGQEFDDNIHMTVLLCPVDFDQVHLGTPATRTVTIRNESTSNKNLQGSYSISSGIAEYETTGSGSFDLSPGNSHLVTIKFTPNGMGTRTGILEIAHNATNTPEQPKTCALTGIGTNNAPNKPSNPSPPNGATDVPVTATLSWTGGDINSHDNDSVTYDVYFGTTDPPPPKEKSRPSTTWDPPGNLGKDTSYFWQIVARDRHGAETQGDIWSLKAEADSCSISVSPLSLDFEGVHLTHAGEGKDLIFVVTCDSSSTKLCTGAVSLTSGSAHFRIVSGGGPFSVASGVSLPVTVRFAPTSLDVKLGTVEVTHECDSPASPVTVSLTGVGTNSPPGIPALLNPPVRTQQGVSAGFTWRATDADGDRVKVCVSWKGGIPGQECDTLRSSGTETDISHSWPNSGYYDIEYWAEDEHGARPEENGIYGGFKVWEEFSGTLFRDNASYVLSGLPNNNYCNLAPLLSGVSNQSESFTLIEWNVGSFPDKDVLVVEATLSLQTQVLGTGEFFRVSKPTGSWNCATVTWNNKPGLGSTLHENFLSTNPATWSMDIESAFSLWVQGSANFGLYVTRRPPWHINEVRQASITNTGADAPRIKYRYRWPY